MIITLIENKYRIRVDEYNHTLERYQTPKLIEIGKNKGEMSQEKWVTMSYHPNVEQCCRRAAKNELLDTEEHITLSEYAGLIEQTYNTMINKAKEELK